MAAEERWYFTKDQINNTPSRKCGIDGEKEQAYRQQAANLIQEMGQRLQVNQLAINTAIVYMHRFYMHHPFTRFHRNSISPAALFLAAKVEEQPRKLEHVIKIAHACLHRESITQLDVQSEPYLERAHELVINENILLQTLGFDVAIDHPHTHVVKCCQLVRATKDLAQSSYFMATNSLHMTTMCLQYKPTVVACVCIYIVCKWSNYEIQRATEGGKDWFYYVDKTVTKELLDLLTNEFMAVVEKCPNKLKKIMSSGQSLDGSTRTYNLNRSSGQSSSSSRSHDSSQNKQNYKTNPQALVHKMNLKEYREKEKRDKEQRGTVSSGDHRRPTHPPTSSSGHHMQHHNISAINSTNSVHGMPGSHSNLDSSGNVRKPHGEHPSRNPNAHMQRTSNTMQQSHSRSTAPEMSGTWPNQVDRHEVKKEIKTEHDNHERNQEGAHYNDPNTAKWMADRSNKHINTSSSGNINSVSSNRHLHNESNSSNYSTYDKIESKPLPHDSIKSEKYHHHENRVKYESSSHHQVKQEVKYERSHHKAKQEVKDVPKQDIQPHSLFGNDTSEFSMKNFLTLGTEPPDNIFDTNDDMNLRNILDEDIFAAPETHHKGVSPPTVPAPLPLSSQPPPNHPHVTVNSTSSNNSSCGTSRSTDQTNSNKRTRELHNDHSDGVLEQSSNHNVSRHPHHLAVNGTASSNHSQVPDRSSNNSLSNPLASGSVNNSSSSSSNSSNNRDRNYRKNRDNRVSPLKSSSSQVSSHSQKTNEGELSINTSKPDQSGREDPNQRLGQQQSSSSSKAALSSVSSVNSSSVSSGHSHGIKSIPSSQVISLTNDSSKSTNNEQPLNPRILPPEHQTVSGNNSSVQPPNSNSVPVNPVLGNVQVHKNKKQHKHKEKKKRKNKDKDKEKDKEKYKDREHKDHKEHKEHKKDKKHKKNKDKDKDRDKDKSKDRYKSTGHPVAEEQSHPLKIKISRDKCSLTPDISGSSSRSSNMAATTSHHTPLATATPTSITPGSLKLKISKARIKTDTTPQVSPNRNLAARDLLSTPTGVKLKIAKDQIQKSDRDSRKRERDRSPSDHPSKLSRHNSPQVLDARWSGQRH